MSDFACENVVRGCQNRVRELYMPCEECIGQAVKIGFKPLTEEITFFYFEPI